MDEVYEILLQLLALTIYGYEEKPKHPLWRNSVRTVAFVGAFISIASLLNLLGNIEFPMFVTLIWGICFVIVITAEYELGSKRVCLAAFIVFSIWLAVLISVEN